MFRDYITIFSQLKRATFPGVCVAENVGSFNGGNTGATSGDRVYVCNTKGGILIIKYYTKLEAIGIHLRCQCQ